MIGDTNIEPSLQQYIEQCILPQYAKFDLAHRLDHVQNVIEDSIYLAQHYPVDLNMVYTISAYHDIGLIEGRDTHQIASGRIIREDIRLREWFTKEQIETMAQATEDHRASAKQEPRSIYGKIVAEADRQIDSKAIVRRTVQYGMAHYPTLTKEDYWKRTVYKAVIFFISFWVLACGSIFF